jgi:hypothetical protein
MSITLSPRGGEGSQLPYEFEPAEYLDTVRRFLHENGAGAVRNPATNEVRLQAAQEEAVSRTFVADEHAALGADELDKATLAKMQGVSRG